MNKPTVRKINGTYYRRLTRGEIRNNGDIFGDDLTSVSVTSGYVHDPHPDSVAAVYGVWRKIPVPEGYRILDLDETVPDFTRHLAIFNDGHAEEVGAGWMHWLDNLTVRNALKTRGLADGEQDYLILAPIATPSVNSKPADAELEALRKENAVLKRRVDVYRRSVDRLRVTLGSVRKHNLELRHTNYAITQKLSKVREVVS